MRRMIQIEAETKAGESFVDYEIEDVLLVLRMSFLILIATALFVSIQPEAKGKISTRTFKFVLKFVRIRPIPFHLHSTIYILYRGTGQGNRYSYLLSTVEG